MKIIEASYGCSFELLGMWAKPHLRAELEEGDDEIQKLLELKQRIDKFYELAFPEKTIQLKQKPLPDIVVKKQMAQAALNGDQKTIDNLNATYQFHVEP